MMYGLYGCCMMYGMYGCMGCMAIHWPGTMRERCMGAHTAQKLYATLYGTHDGTSRGGCEEDCEHGVQTTMGGLRWCWGVPGSVLKASGHMVSRSSHASSHRRCAARCMCGCMEFCMYAMYGRPYSVHAWSHANVWAYSAYSPYIPYIGHTSHTSYSSHTAHTSYIRLHPPSGEPLFGLSMLG